MKEIKDKNENKKLIWIAFITSFILLFVAYNFFIAELPQKQNLVQINDILKDDIKLKKGRRGSRNLIIKLQKYPDIDFMIGSVTLRETYYQDLIDENKIGDSIKIFIDTKEYNRKILKTERIPFPKNFLQNKTIGIIQISNKQTEYLNIADYNNGQKQNNYLGVAIFGFFGFFMLFLGLKGIEYHKKNFK